MNGVESGVDRRGFIALCRENGISCGEREAELLLCFAEHLLRENEKHNLTAIRDPRAILLRHFVDSMTVLPRIKNGARLLDIGSGAGFPAVPIAVMRPDVSVTALDATAKKVGFIKSAAARLGLENLIAVGGRAEELARTESRLRESFDAVTARAVAHSRILCELGAPFLRIGGTLIAMKGASAQTAAELGECAIAGAVGLAEPEVTELTITDASVGETLTRTIVTWTKASATPGTYPRRYSQIVKG